MTVLPFIEAMNDLPDPRGGKTHSFPFIVTATILAIMAGRSNMSSIHRYIRNKIEWLREISQTPEACFISRAHLPRLLGRVAWDDLNELIKNILVLR